ncbi:MAG: HAD family hydrolase [Acidobacteria bacterium]|nr:HAD family hydrolase [Acidobacteriota bacterium]
MTAPCALLIDADDTLWENNIYFERAFHQFCEFLDHSHLTPDQVRRILDEIELVNIQVHGYGSANFGRNMVQCYHKLVEREVSPADAGHIIELARAINDHPLEIIAGVPETLAYLAGRHTLLLVTKGNHEEQQRKVDQSGFHSFFREVIIVKEKDAAAYRKIVVEFGLEAERTWMVGNSPKSDINPALEAGIGAVFVPHDMTWHLEHQEIRSGERLRMVETFAGLRQIF